MNETQIREERSEGRVDENVDPQKWADAMQNLVRIIERSEQKLGFFENRVKQAKFMNRPNQRMLRAAGAQVGAHSAQLENLMGELRHLERLHSGGVHLRQPTENELRRIWGWIDRPGIREILYTGQVSFERFLEDWQGWSDDEHVHAFAIDIRTTHLLIGFVLLYSHADDADSVTLKFIGIRPDYRARGYGTDAILEVLHYVFETLEAENVTLQVSAENGPALVCFENAGFQYLNYSDAGEQVYTMGIDRAEWNGEKSMEEQTDTGRLTTPLRVFFESEE